MPMRRVCAWCQRDLGTVPGEDGMVTHGMCDTCEATVLAEIRALSSTARVACDPDNEEPAQDRPIKEEK
jgi:hypothetical protein